MLFLTASGRLEDQDHFAFDGIGCEDRSGLGGIDKYPFVTVTPVVPRQALGALHAYPHQISLEAWGVRVYYKDVSS